MKLKKQLLVLLALGLMTACTSTSEETESKEVSTQEPSAEALLEANKQALLEDATVKEYFDTLEEAVDEYMKMLVKMTEKAAEREKKGDSDENAIGLLGDMMGTMVESGGKLAELTKKIDALKEKAETLKADLSEEEKQAFVAIYANIVLRMVEAAEKAEKTEAQE